MRVLFVSSPALGHLHPILPLAVAFADRGDEVRVATGMAAFARVEEAGLTPAPAGPDESWTHAEMARRYPEAASVPPQERSLFWFPRLFGEVLAAAMLPDLVSIVSKWKPDLIVHEHAAFAAPIAAAMHGLPSVAHAFGSLIPKERVAAAGERAAPLWSAAGLEPRPYGGAYEFLYLDIYPPSMRHSDYGHVPHLQSLRPETFATRGGDALAPLADGLGSRIVYVTFGTVSNRAPAFTEAVAGAADAAEDVVVTVGPNGDPEAFGALPSNVHMYRYIPQTALLARCAAVISHSGSGTLLGALSAGVPQLCLPQGADQFENAKYASQVGAALALMPGEVSRSSVAAALGRILSEPAFADSAHAVAGEIAGMPSPGEVATQLAQTYGPA